MVYMHNAKIKKQPQLLVNNKEIKKSTEKYQYILIKKYPPIVHKLNILSIGYLTVNKRDKLK